MKRIITVLLALFLLIAAGGFMWLITADVPIEQREIVKTIPNERFFDFY